MFRDGAAHNQSPPLSLGNFVDAKSFEQDSCRSQQESGEKDFLKPPPIGDNNPDSIRGSVNPEADRDVDFGAVESKGRTRTEPDREEGWLDWLSRKIGFETETLSPSQQKIPVIEEEGATLIKAPEESREKRKAE